MWVVGVMIRLFPQCVAIADIYGLIRGSDGHSPALGEKKPQQRRAIIDGRGDAALWKAQKGVAFYYCQEDKLFCRFEF